VKGASRNVLDNRDIRVGWSAFNDRERVPRIELLYYW